MRVKYITGSVVIVGFLAVIGVLMARHQSQNNSISNTPNAVTAVNNTQGTSQENKNSPYPIGNIGDTFTIAQDSIKLRLVQIIDPDNAGGGVKDGKGAKFEITNFGGKPITWYYISNHLRAYSSMALGTGSGGEDQAYEASFTCPNENSISGGASIPAGASESGCFTFSPTSNYKSINIYYIDSTAGLSVLALWKLK